MLEGTATALQRVTAHPAPKPYRISDLIQRNWDGSNDTEKFRLWMQAWSNEGETMLVCVESSDKFDGRTLSVDCSQKQFRTIEASLYQVLH